MSLQVHLSMSIFHVILHHLNIISIYNHTYGIDIFIIYIWYLSIYIYIYSIFYMLPTVTPPFSNPKRFNPHLCAGTSSRSQVGTWPRQDSSGLEDEFPYKLKTSWRRVRVLMLVETTYKILHQILHQIEYFYFQALVEWCCDAASRCK